jgi:hypothetical protein
LILSYRNIGRGRTKPEKGNMLGLLKYSVLYFHTEKLAEEEQSQKKVPLSESFWEIKMADGPQE